MYIYLTFCGGKPSFPDFTVNMMHHANQHHNEKPSSVRATITSKSTMTRGFADPLREMSASPVMLSQKSLNL